MQVLRQPASYKLRTDYVVTRACGGRSDWCGLYVHGASISPASQPSTHFLLDGRPPTIMSCLTKDKYLMTTVSVHKTGFNVDGDHDDSAMTESMFF